MVRIELLHVFLIFHGSNSIGLESIFAPMYFFPATNFLAYEYRQKYARIFFIGGGGGGGQWGVGMDWAKF